MVVKQEVVPCCRQHHQQPAWDVLRINVPIPVLRQAAPIDPCCPGLQRQAILPPFVHPFKAIKHHIKSVILRSLLAGGSWMQHQQPCCPQVVHAVRVDHKKH